MKTFRCLLSLCMAALMTISASAFTGVSASLSTVNDVKSAVNVVQNGLVQMGEAGDLDSEAGVNYATQFVETAIYRAAYKKHQESVLIINRENVEELLETARQARDAAMEKLQESLVQYNQDMIRDVALSVRFITPFDLTLVIMPDILMSEAEQIVVDTSYYIMKIYPDELHYDFPDGLDSEPLKVKLTVIPEVIGATVSVVISNETLSGHFDLSLRSGSMSSDAAFLYRVAEDVELELNNYDINTVTNTVEGKIYRSGIYNSGIGKSSSLLKPFTDLDGISDSMREAIQQLQQRNILNGNGNHTFTPHNPITRGAFAKILMNALQKRSRNLISPFKDVPANLEHSPQILTAADMHYINGYQPTYFGTSDPLTRNQLCVILTRVMKDVRNYSNASNVSSVLRQYRSISLFSGSETPEYQTQVQEAVAFLTEKNIIPLDENGNYASSETGSFIGYKSVTRGEVAQIIYNMLPYLKL